MAAKMLATLLLFFICYIHMSRITHSTKNVNVKKSFLSDAMNEMEYGSGNADKTNITRDAIVSITRIYPSHIVKSIKVDEKGIEKVRSTDITPLEQTAKDVNGTRDGSALQIGNVQADLNSTVSTESNNNTEVVTNDSGTTSPHTKDVSTAINLLRSFVRKLLNQNSTKLGPKSANETVIHDHKLKEQKILRGVALQVSRTNMNKTSTFVSGVKYNMTSASVNRFKYNDEKRQRLKHLIEEEKNLRHTLQLKEHEIKNLQEENSHPSYNVKTSDQKGHQNNPTKVLQNKTNESQLNHRFETMNGFPAELLLKLKKVLDATKKKNKRRKKEHNISREKTSSMKAFETAKKLVKAAFARKQLYKAEEDFYKKVKEMMHLNITTGEKELKNKNNSKEVDQGSADVNDYIKTLEEEQKNLVPVERRTQPVANSSSISEALNGTASQLSPFNSSHKGASGLPVNTIVSEDILNKLNDPKKTDEKSVKAVAHLEEKVAEQQDKMYDDLIHHTLNKGFGYDNDDANNEDDDEEDPETRDAYNQPSENGPGLLENYGDFQDSDEQAHLVRSQVTNPTFKKTEKVRFIDENAIYSLKKDTISRPSRTVTKLYRDKTV